MSTNQKLGILICGHGSRNRLAVQEFQDLVNGLRVYLKGTPVEYGYLEFARPIIRDGLEKLRQQSVDHIIAIPAMLFAAGHTKNDIPSVLNTYAKEENISISYGRELGVDRLMIEAAGMRIKESLSQSSEYPLSETMLVVVGRGSSDPDANSNVSKITRMLVEGFGFGWGETLYSGVTFPLVEPGLKHCVKLGFKRIIVFPYFLFTGVLVNRIREHTNRVANQNPQIEFITAKYLSSHKSVIATFVERIKEVSEGNVYMNCSLCKYRDAVLGFESEVGLAQTSHHHHVEGNMEECSLCENECNGKCQDLIQKNSTNQVHSHQSSESDHQHDHQIYRNADHPLGPLTLNRPLTNEK